MSKQILLQPVSECPEPGAGGFVSFTSSFPAPDNPPASQVYALPPDALTHDQPKETFPLIVTASTHDISNLLTVLLASLDMILDTNRREHIDRDLQDMRSTLERVVLLVQRLGRMAGSGAGDDEHWLDVAQVLCETAHDCLANSGITLEYAGEDLPPVWMDPLELSRIIQNIVINARQAMPQGGTLRIKAGNYHHPAGKYFVELVFSDTGCGIAQNDIPHIFDLFYTTKHRGNGIGLAYVKALLTRLGGEIKIVSEFGQGTTVILHLSTRQHLAPAAGP